MSTIEHFTLQHYEIPNFPVSSRYIDQLLWCIAVADHDDGDLAFLASLLAFCIRRDGLTKRQQPFADKVINRLRAMWHEGRLRAHSMRDPDAEVDDLSRAEPVGRA